MKFRYILLALLAVCSLQVSAKKSSAAKDSKQKETKSKAPAFASARDSASYSLGVLLGTQFSSGLNEADLNQDLFAEAFRIALAGGETAIDVETAGQCYSRYMSAVQEEAVKAQKKQSDDFFVENGKRQGVVTTASGLQYEVVRLGDGAMPGASDEVLVHYEGTLLDGSKFDSSYDRGEPTKFRCNQVIKGFSEGLQLMPVGSKYTLYIPYDLGYGERGAGNMIRPYSALIFTVELLDITNK